MQDGTERDRQYLLTLSQSDRPRDIARILRDLVTSTYNKIDEAGLVAQSVAIGSPGQLFWNDNGVGSGTAAVIYATTGAHITIVAQSAAVTPAVIRGAASQTAPLTTWWNDSGTVLASVNNAGDINANNYSTSKGVESIVAGVQAGGLLSTGGGNVVIGYQAGNSMPAGSTQNTILGYQAGQKYTGNAATFFGYQAGKLTTGSGVTVIGYQAGTANLAGDLTAVGALAGAGNTNGTRNTAVGRLSFETNTTGNNNTCLGFQTLNLINGTGNTAVGQLAGFVLTSGTNCSFFGNQAGLTSSATGLSNATAIGYNAQVTQSASLVLGGTGGDAVRVGIGTTAPVATLHVVNPVAAQIVEIVQGAAGQTANLTEWQNNSNTVMSYINNAGEYTLNNNLKINTKDTSGNVWPLAYLDNGNNASFRNHAVTGGSYYGCANVSNSTSFVTFQTAGVNRVAITNNGTTTFNSGTNIAAGDVVIIIKASTSHTANLTEWQSSAGVVGARINAAREFSNPCSTGTSNGGERFGAGAAPSMTAGTVGNTVFGQSAGQSLANGAHNTIIGFQAAPSLTTGSNNCVIGSQINIPAGGSETVAVGRSHTITATSRVVCLGTGNTVAFDSCISLGTFADPVKAGQFVTGRDVSSWMFQHLSSTTTRPAAELQRAWTDSTDATRAGRLTLHAYSVATAQEGMRIDADSGGVKLGFYGATAVTKAAAAANTSGASLTDLEIEVNKLKNIIRNLGLMAT